MKSLLSNGWYDHQAGPRRGGWYDHQAGPRRGGWYDHQAEPRRGGWYDHQAGPRRGKPQGLWRIIRATSSASALRQVLGIKKNTQRPFGSGILENGCY